jgi:hypothetical protein
MDGKTISVVFLMDDESHTELFVNAGNIRDWLRSKTCGL